MSSSFRVLLALILNAFLNKIYQPEKHLLGGLIPLEGSLNQFKTMHSVMQDALRKILELMT